MLLGLLMGLPIFLSARGLVVTSSQQLYHGLENAMILKMERGITDITSYFDDTTNYLPAKNYEMNNPQNEWAYIIRLTIENKISDKLMFYMPYYGIEHISYYIAENDGTVYNSGNSGYIKLKDKKYQGNSDLLELNIPQNQAYTLYLYLEGTKLTKQRFFIGSTQKIDKITHQNDLLFGIYFGLALIIIIYNLILYFQVKEIDHLVYSALVFCFAFVQANLYGYASEFIWPSKPWLSNYSELFQAVSGMVTAVWAIVFLKLRTNAKISYLLSFVFIALFMLMFIIEIIQPTRMISVYFSPALLSQFMNVFLLISGVYVLVKGFKPAIYYVFSNFFLMLSVLVFFAFAYDAINYSFVSYNSLAIGSGLEILFFSLALAAKVNYYKRDKERAEEERLHALEENRRLISEQNEMLELQVEQRTQELNAEKEKSDKLIKNILPLQTIRELNEQGYSQPKMHTATSVLFADVVSFTAISSDLDAEVLVNELDKLFTSIDKVIENYKIEKIKTIGDAYLCVSGLEEEDATRSARDLVDAALDIIQFTEEFNALQKENGIKPFKLRIGIASGPLAAGVVGIKKYQFDIWGDTVNTASRMQSTGVPGEINISESTFELIRNFEDYDFESRGMVDTKGKGGMKMYLVRRKIKTTTV